MQKNAKIQKKYLCFAPGYFILLKRQSGQRDRCFACPSSCYASAGLRQNEARRKKRMSYVDEVIEKVVAKNPAEPEFHRL